MKKGKLVVLVFVGAFSLVLFLPVYFYFLYVDPKVVFENRSEEHVMVMVHQGFSVSVSKASPAELFAFRPNGDDPFAIWVSIIDDRYSCGPHNNMCCTQVGENCFLIDGVFSRNDMRVFFIKNGNSDFSLELNEMD